MDELEADGRLDTIEQIIRVRGVSFVGEDVKIEMPLVLPDDVEDQ